MSNGIIFISGFVTGGFTVFIVTAVTVWKPIIEEWKDQFKIERARRIEAESSSAHAALGAPTRAAWGSSVLPYVETHPADTGPQIGSQSVVNLTDVDDPFMDEMSNGD